MTTATEGYQTHLYSGTAGAAAAAITTKMAQVESLSLPGLTVGSSEITNMDSSSGYREFMSGMIDANEITVNCVYVKAEMTLLVAMLRTTKAC